MSLKTPQPTLIKLRSENLDKLPKYFEAGATVSESTAQQTIKGLRVLLEQARSRLRSGRRTEREVQAIDYLKMAIDGSINGGGKMDDRQIGHHCNAPYFYVSDDQVNAVASSTEIVNAVATWRFLNQDLQEKNIDEVADNRKVCIIKTQNRIIICKLNKDGYIEGTNNVQFVVKNDFGWLRFMLMTFTVKNRELYGVYTLSKWAPDFYGEIKLVQEFTRNESCKRLIYFKSDQFCDNQSMATGFQGQQPEPYKTTKIRQYTQRQMPSWTRDNLTFFQQRFINDGTQFQLGEAQYLFSSSMTRTEPTTHQINKNAFSNSQRLSSICMKDFVDEQEFIQQNHNKI